jgi:hypothetical protein
MLPNLLLIGAMKAGTTSLHEDLSALADVFMCPEKEPNDLLDPSVETPEGRAAYGAKFPSHARWRGEASTAYAMAPTHPGVADRARRVLGPDVRILYLTRDPIARIVSQYHHLWGLGLETRPLNRAVIEDPSYVAYSRYAQQLAPWQAAFPGQVLVLRFEDYVTDPAAVMARICAFLDLPAPGPIRATHRNASTGKAFVPRGSLAARVFHSPFYLHRIKPLVPNALKHAVKARLLPKAPPLRETLSPATRATLTQRLEAPCPPCR